MTATATAGPRARLQRLAERDAVVASVAWLVSAAVFFRETVLSGFDALPGNAGDARLLVVIQEHWVRVAQGQATWRNPEFFHPTQGVLGYTDTLLLNGIVYAPLRAVGLDPFLAFQWTIIAVSLLGFVALFTIIRRTIGLSAPLAAALTAVAIFPNNLGVMWGHQQLHSLHWVPVVLALALSAWRATTQRAAMWRAAAAGLLFGLLLYSSFYVAWFTALAAAVFGLVVVAVHLGFDRGGVDSIVRIVRGRWRAAAAFLLGAIPPLVLFGFTYLPVLSETGGRQYSDAMSYSVLPREVVNVGRSNELWGALMGRWHSPERSRAELTLSPTPVLVAAIIGACVFLGRRRPPGDSVRTIGLAASVTALVLLVLPIRFPVGSLWRVPWVVMPGAVGIRAIARVGLVTGMLAVIAVATVMSRIKRDAPQARLLLAVIVALLLVEQVNGVRTSYLDRSDEISRLMRAPAPPPECRSFYVVDPNPIGPHSYYEASLDAMLLSQHFDLPTINGYSGTFPPGYRVADPYADGYVDRVHEWATTHGVGGGLCAYDRTATVWTSS